MENSMKSMTKLKSIYDRFFFIDYYGVRLQLSS